MKNLNDLLSLLAESKIPFVVVGGFAGILHGSTLVTRDLDLCTVLTPENVEKLRMLFRDFHPKHRLTPQRLSFLDVPPSGQTLNNLYLETDIGIVDFITSITGVGDFDAIIKNAELIRFKDHDINVINLEDLIKAKESMGRDKDKLAARELKAILQAKSSKSH